MRKFVLFHLPVILYGAAVLVVSSIPNLHTPKIRILAADKLLHFLEYALFAFLIFRSFSNLTRRTPTRLAFWLGLLFLAAFAVLDEYVQSLTPGRSSEVLDYLTDLFGGAVILVLLWLRQRSRAASAG